MSAITNQGFNDFNYIALFTPPPGGSIASTLALSAHDPELATLQEGLKAIKLVRAEHISSGSNEIFEAISQLAQSTLADSR